jgi:molecular chaperone DnaK
VVPVEGGAVAVGGSDGDAAPRAWRLDGGTWTPAEVVDATGRLAGAMNAVARLPGRGAELVAVGWVTPRPAPGSPTPTGAAREAAVWTSRDGASWTLFTAGALGTEVSGLGELYAVVVDPGGGLVAAGVDWSADPRSGDGALLRSADGRSWEPVPVTGLDGRGPTALRGLLVDGSGLVAVGSRQGAGSTEPVVWTSPDGTAWSEVAVLEHTGPGAAEAAAVVRAPTGELLVAGTATELDGTPVPAIWSGPGPDALQPYAVDVAGASIDGLAVVSGQVTAVGTRRGDEGLLPAAWTVELGR